MSTEAENVLQKALHLPPRDRAAIAHDLLSSLDRPDDKIDNLWAEEIENRITADMRGEMEKVPAEKVFGKYDKS